MSAFAKNNSAKNNSAKKSYCKVCHDAGKPESMYTNHCVKTYNINTGKTDTTCPTLLALECRYCYGKGHTVKFCTVLEENKKKDNERARDRAREQYHAKQEQVAPVQTKRKSTNAFAALDSDDSEDETQQIQTQTPTQTPIQTPIQTPTPKDEFPALNGFANVAQNKTTKSYSCVAATPADERRLEISRKARTQKQEQVQKQKIEQATKFYESEDDDDDDVESEDEVVVVTRYEPFAGQMLYTNTASVSNYDDDYSW